MRENLHASELHVFTLWTEDGLDFQASYICSTYAPEEPLKNGSAAPEEDCLFSRASPTHILGRGHTRYMAVEERDTGWVLNIS